MAQDTAKGYDTWEDIRKGIPSIDDEFIQEYNKGYEAGFSQGRVLGKDDGIDIGFRRGVSAVLIFLAVLAIAVAIVVVA